MSKFFKRSTLEVREEFSDTINNCCFGEKYCIVTRRNKPLCAIISYWDFLNYLKIKGEKLPFDMKKDKKRGEE